MGDRAVLDPRPGGEFTLYFDDRCVQGQYVVLERPHRLVITWGRLGSHELPPFSSTLEVSLAREGEGTRVAIVHQGLPESEAPRHAAGWRHYLEPPRAPRCRYRTGAAHHAGRADAERGLICRRSSPNAADRTRSCRRRPKSNARCLGWLQTTSSAYAANERADPRQRGAVISDPLANLVMQTIENEPGKRPSPIAAATTKPRWRRTFSTRKASGSGVLKSEKALVQAILDDVDDDASLQVYVDWLEEQGHPARRARGGCIGGRAGGPTTRRC